MANEVLKQLLVAVGFKIDESGMRKQQEALKSTERAVFSITKAEAEADAQRKIRSEEHGRRMERQKSTYADLATAANLYARTIVSVAEAVSGAIAKMMSGYDQFHFISQRTGASVGNIKALGYAFGQVGSSAEQAMAAVENFAKARRTNPGVDGLVRSLGVSTKGDSVDVMMNSIDAIKAKNPYYTGAQIAGQLGISEEQFETFSRYTKQLRDFKDEYKSVQAQLNVNSDETSSASASISKSWNSVVAVLGVLSEKLYAQLAPVLERIVTGFKNWLAANPEKVEAILQGIARAAEAVGQGILKFGDWIADEENQKKVLDFWTNLYERIENITNIITILLGYLAKLMGFFDNKFVKGYGEILFGGGLAGQLFGGSAQAAEGRAGGSANDNGGEKPGFVRRSWNAVKRAFGGSADLTPTPGSKATISGRTFDSKAPGIMKRLMADFDLSKEEAAVVLGNLGHESAGFTAFEEGGNGPGRGWAQWTDRGRKARFFKYATDNRLDPKSDEANYGFLKWELENTHRSSIAKLKRAQGGQAKMYAFEQDFEGAGIKHYDRRFNYMRKAMEAYDRSEQGGVQEGASTARPAFRSNVAPGARMSPGGFDVNAYLRTPPMGATSNTTDSSKTFHNNAPVTVNVTGGSGDAASIGAAAGRGAAMAGDMNLRNVQTALR